MTLASPIHLLSYLRSSIVSRRLSTLFVSATLALVTSACGGGEAQEGGPGGGPGAMPPPLVEVVTVRPQNVPNIVELPGRIEPVRVAEVRARADGIIERRLFEEGSDVRAGQPLFRIDPRDLREQVAQARATLQRSEAARTNAAAIVRRYSPLIRERAVSAQEYDQAQATLRQETANVAEARAALARAQIALGYTTVRSPISGQVGRAQVTEGALVSASQATLLTTVAQPSPIYATFTESSATILDLRQADQAGTTDVRPLRQIEVKLILPNGREYGPVGRLDFASPDVQAETGSQVLRAVFPNAERLLLPGQFVRGRVTVGTRLNGILLPARAVQVSERGASVSVVARDGTVAARPVQLGGQIGNSWLIKSGVRPGERVITEGWQKAQPGGKVQVKGDAPPPGAPAGKAPGR
jgi:RND family efflux transporter MFP subunit